MESLRDKAKVFSALHDEGMVVLPNAWDAGSAAVIAHAGAAAIATSSGGVSWSLGRGDGQRLTRAEMTEAVRRIAAAVAVPVSADIEGGYGPAPSDVAATIAAIIDAGAVGVNLEDSQPDSLFSPDAQAARLAAARSAALSAGLPELWINARTDVYLRAIGDPAGRFDDVLARAHAYAAAGADSLFVPGLLDLDVLRRLTAASPLPVAVMAGPGAPPAAALAATGARRLTVGTAPAQAAYATAHRAARALLHDGTYTELAGDLDYGTLNGLFA